MATTIFGLLILLGFAFYVMNPEERMRVGREGLAAMGRAKDTAFQEPAGCESFHDALRARTPRVLVTPALVALNAAIFVLMLFDAGAVSNPETLVGWGGSFGPRTTNGESWRLVTTMFVHSGMLHLLASVAGLVQLGFILERLVGHVAFASVYVASGLLASLVSLSAHPVAVNVGASGAIFGMYGLLLASLIWDMLRSFQGRSALGARLSREPRAENPEPLLDGTAVTIPLMVVRWLGPAAALFILFNVANDSLDSVAELAGLVTGFVWGLVLAREVNERKPRVLRAAAATAVAIVIVIVSAVPLRGVTDVRPEIERIVSVEDRTASAYQTEVDRFKIGRTSAKSLAQMIDQTIMPELHEARVRLMALDGVPHEQEPLVAGAEAYLRLRDESWRLRAEGLHKSDMLLLRKAESPERAALEALQRIRPADQK